MIFSKKIILRRRNGGQTLLTLVLVIGGMIVAAGVAFLAIAVSVTSSGYAYRAAQTAANVSMAGIEDVALQLTRNSSFSSAGYSVPVGAYAAAVTVSVSTPSSGYDTALSIAIVANATRKLDAVFSVSTSTGQVSLVSVQTVP